MHPDAISADKDVDLAAMGWVPEVYRRQASPCRICDADQSGRDDSDRAHGPKLEALARIGKRLADADLAGGMAAIQTEPQQTGRIDRPRQRHGFCPLKPEAPEIGGIADQKDPC